jgi:hypothetical protein
MKTIFILILLLFINCEVIKHLNEDQYLEFTDKHEEYILILCKNKREVNQFKNLKAEIPILVFNTEKQTFISKLYKPTSYPNIQFISSEKSHTYNGPISNEKISLFIEGIKSTKIEEIQTLDELKESMKKNNLRYTILVVGKYENVIDLNVLAQVCKGISINGIYHSNNPKLVDFFHLSKYEFELFLFTDALEEKRLYVQTLDKYDEYEFTKFINLMIRNVYGEIRLLDLSLALSGKPIPTLFFIHGNDELESIHMEMKMIGEEYVNEINVVHGKFNNRYMQYISKYFKLTEKELPALVMTRPDKYNDDDVEKYLLSFGKDISRDKILEFLNNPDGNRVYLSEPDEYVKMIGENLVEVLSEPIKEGSDVVLLICPTDSKKHHRIRKRLEIVFQKMHKQNNETLNVDEIDPFLNDVPDIAYTEIPSIVILSPSENEKRWKHINYNGDFTTESIINFVLKNSNRKLVADPVENYIMQDEAKMPIYSVSKYLYEKNRLELSKEFFKYGLKRMWRLLKMKGKVKMINHFYDDLYDGDAQDFDEYDSADIEITHNEL